MVRRRITVVDMKWLGLHGDDIDRYGIPTTCMFALSSNDQKKARSLMDHAFVKVGLRQMSWAAGMGVAQLGSQGACVML